MDRGKVRVDRGGSGNGEPPSSLIAREQLEAVRARLSDRQYRVLELMVGYGFAAQQARELLGANDNAKPPPSAATVRKLLKSALDVLAEMWSKRMAA